MKLFVFLIFALVILVGCSAPSEDSQTEKINDCSAKLTDSSVKSSTQRQINTLKCFRNLAEQDLNVGLCLDLESTPQIGCLIAFAREKEDLSLCELSEIPVIIDDCIENSMQNLEDCSQLKKEANIENCESRDPSELIY
jgi:hypothetical protein